MNTAALLEEVAEVFPLVPKPKGLAFSFHKDGCLQCQFLRADLEYVTGPELPPKAIRWICNDMSCLSAKAWRWALPSYLKHCLTVDATIADLETEFLIYNLGPELKFQKETLNRISLLDAPQIACLIHFLEWCAAHPYWSDYCPKDIETAIAFMRTIRR